jgi:hypothetical protein
MQRALFYWILAALILLAVPLLAVAAPMMSPLAAPDRASTSSSFSLSTTTSSQRFTVPVSSAGCVLAQVKSWSAATSGTTAAGSLTLSLAVSRRTAQTTKAATSLVPLWTSVAFTSSDLAGTRSGTVTIALPSRSGSARGTLWIEYPPTQTPCEFKASPSRTRGRVDLSWRYTGSAFKGSFLVQRSSDGRTWRAVTACTRSASSSTYTCSDTGLTSGRTYYYRACASTGSTCGSSAVTPPLNAIAP